MSGFIKVYNLTVKVKDRTILSHVNFELNKGDFLVLLGSNGSGKSTLIRAINRETKYSGTIKSCKNVSTIYQMPNDNIFPELTLYDNYLVREKSKALSKHEFAKIMGEFNNNLKSKVNNLAGELSGGEKQSFILGLVSIHPPELLLLDEHTSALDPSASVNIMKLTNQLIDEHSITTIMATHDLDDAIAYGNKILVLKNGMIVDYINKSEKKVDKSELIAYY